VGLNVGRARLEVEEVGAVRPLVRSRLRAMGGALRVARHRLGAGAGILSRAVRDYITCGAEPVAVPLHLQFARFGLKPGRYARFVGSPRTRGLRAPSDGGLERARSDMKCVIENEDQIGAPHGDGRADGEIGIGEEPDLPEPPDRTVDE
jgi:hypothetical protein